MVIYSQLILNRASLDINAVKQYKNNEVIVDALKLKDLKINISKILWRMPSQVVNNQKPLTYAFRSWELCEYPFYLKTFRIPGKRRHLTN
ncbi:Uncharacterized protein FWK35_00018907 [Aphis craccivora]|uniref:Uncharacterized protein n=1 Tax=Aphis craccivora TaxID=307492 RepID=A0A6G0VYS9_APHCR|nr:Uncharacterized protein FWK35_00018907 [Aphis craccivora]